MSELTIERRPHGSATGDLAAAWDRLLDAAPPLRLPARRTVVVAPHPDDESLSTGGLIMHQAARGVPVIVVAVTDGEAAYPNTASSELASTRRDEQATALSLLGVPAVATVRLGLPDSSVGCRQDDLVARLGRLVEPGDVLVAPWRHDWHPDHEACGRAAELVAHDRDCTLISSLFWAFHRVDPRDHPDVGIAVLPLTADESMWRWEAVRAHASQFDGGALAPILDEALVARLRRPAEYYVSSTS